MDKLIDNTLSLFLCKSIESSFVLASLMAKLYPKLSKYSLLIDSFILIP